jgi:hypothetical protein
VVVEMLPVAVSVLPLPRVTSPFRLTAPEPVAKVPAPLCRKLLDTVIAPVVPSMDKRAVLFVYRAIDVAEVVPKNGDSTPVVWRTPLASKVATIVLALLKNSRMLAPAVPP